MFSTDNIEINIILILRIMSSAKIGTQPKALLKLPKEMPSNIVNLTFNSISSTVNHKAWRI
jgi:hypothetical protein